MFKPKYICLNPTNLIQTTQKQISIWGSYTRSEEHTSELQSQSNLVCRLLLEKKNNRITTYTTTTNVVNNAITDYYKTSTNPPASHYDHLRYNSFSARLDSTDYCTNTQACTS